MTTLNRRAFLGLTPFAGGAFGPDGRMLFVNIQTPGMAPAIRRPWEGGRCKREPYGAVTNKFITT
jgi:secreted PhoX family phosphatase